MARRYTVDEILGRMPREDYLAFEELCITPGTPCFKRLWEWLGDRGYVTTQEAVSRWYAANRDRFSMVSPRLALWRSLSQADERRQRFGTWLDSNWTDVEQSLGDALRAGNVIKLLELMATLDLGVRVAASQLHNLETRMDQRVVIEATIAQVFRYIHLELQGNGLDSLRLEALEALEGAIADRIASENKWQS